MSNSLIFKNVPNISSIAIGKYAKVMHRVWRKSATGIKLFNRLLVTHVEPVMRCHRISPRRNLSKETMTGEEKTFLKSLRETVEGGKLNSLLSLGKGGWGSCSIRYISTDQVMEVLSFYATSLS
jgi:hypothetical protein